MGGGCAHGSGSHLLAPFYAVRLVLVQSNARGAVTDTKTILFSHSSNQSILLYTREELVWVTKASGARLVWVVSPPLHLVISNLHTFHHSVFRVPMMKNRNKSRYLSTRRLISTCPHIRLINRVV